jgi:hypothetical protein
MRNETEIRENLEWLTTQCTNFKDDEARLVIRQLETLLWVLGHERDEATAMAEAIWVDSRLYREQHPRDI